MTDVFPVVSPVQIPANLLTFRPVTEITPFTFRSGITYMALLELIRKFSTEYLPSYLETEFGDMRESWEDNLTTLQTAVNTALSEQATTVNQQLASTLAEIISGANLQLNDAAILAALESASSTSLAYLDGRYDAHGAAAAEHTAWTTAFGPISDFVNGVKVYYAPAPTGTDDTAALTAFINAAQSSHGVVLLGEGTYIFNYTSAQSFNQPSIRGRGKKYTFLTAKDTTQPILKFQGGSGGNSGGYVSDVTFTKTTTGVAGIGLELADVCDVHWDRIEFAGNLAEAIKFHVTQSTGFCEFNSGEATIAQTVALPIHYATDFTTQTSFHGSGLTGGVVNFAGAVAVQIDNHAFPYNAPMSATFFAFAAGAVIFRNLYTAIKVGFFGFLRVENQTNGIMSAADNSYGDVYFAGDALVNTAQTYLGVLFLCHAIYWTAGGTFVHFKPWRAHVALVTGTNTLTTRLQNGETATVTVNVIGPNYAAWYRLSVWQNPFNGNGSAVVIDHSVYNNGTGIGEVQFFYQNYQLLIKNDSFPATGYDAFVTIDPAGASIAADNLRQ